MLQRVLAGASSADVVSQTLDPSATSDLVPRFLSPTSGVVPLLAFNITTNDPAQPVQQRPMSDFYYRIWLSPQLLRLTNPQFGVPIEFGLWNAYPFPNTLNTVTVANGVGLALALTVPTTFREIEFRTLSLIVSESAPPEVNATFNFNFNLGTGVLLVQGLISDFVQMFPDPPIVERMEWLTDIIRSWNGTEQRVALRGVPRRRIGYTLPLDTEAERRRQYIRWFRSLGTRIVIPYYQYGAVTTAASAAGTLTVFCDIARTDLRVGEYAILYNTSTEQGFVVRVATISGTGFTVETALPTNVAAGWIVAPMFLSRLVNRSGIEMDMITGRVKLDAEALEYQDIVRPGGAVALQTFNGLNVLDRRPLADSGVAETFDAGYEVIDSETGNKDIRTAWAHPQIEGGRRFLIQRSLQPSEMDWWRTFLAACRGQQRAFYAPTWRPDLELAEAFVPGSQTLQTTSRDYAVRLRQYPTYQQLAIQTTTGIVYRGVSAAVETAAGSQVTLNAPVADPITTVSFLNLCRLGSDEVTLTHDHGHTFIDLVMRTTDQ